MSTISSSTTSTTAYKVTADTTGTLVIQTGATPTTAVTVAANQVVTLAQALPVASGGTGATTNAGAAFALKGANSDITSLSGLTTALSVAQGGTGATTSAAAPFALKGANSDITSLSGLTTPLSEAQGGTGTSSGVIGSGQTWTNVTASRAAGTTYTNTTGKPILVDVVWGLSTTGGHGADFTVAGVVVSRIRNNASASGTFPLAAGVIVPPSATYLVTVSGSGSISLWIELR